jgi:HlyD family secretion protein
MRAPLSVRALRTGMLLSVVGMLLLSGCGKDAPQALGTLEFDRVAVPAPVAERIVAIDVREGERVAAGQALLQLETTRTAAAT